jgi:hypothetical protein
MARRLIYSSTPEKRVPPGCLVTGSADFSPLHFMLSSRANFQKIAGGKSTNLLVSILMGDRGNRANAVEKETHENARNDRLFYSVSVRQRARVDFADLLFCRRETLARPAIHGVCLLRPGFSNKSPRREVTVSSLAQELSQF